MTDFGVGAMSPCFDAGFWSNPFRALTNEEWETIAVLPPSIAALVHSLDAPHIQLLGDAGRGKSSMLQGIVREAGQGKQTACYEYLPVGEDTFRTIPKHGDWFCLDEVQRLSPAECDRFLRLAHTNRLFLASHENLAPLFADAGIPLETVSLSDLGAEHFATVLQNRLRHFARPFVQTATLTPDAIAFLRERFGSDLRGAERFLYAYFQNHVRTTGIITAHSLSLQQEPPHLKNT